MSEQEKKELNDAIEVLVDRIFERGRESVHEEAGEFTVKDGGPALAKKLYAGQIKSLAKTEALSLAKRLIGNDVEVAEEYLSIMDESKTPSSAHLAVNQLKNSQRFIISEYENGRAPEPKQPNPQIPIDQPGTDELSANEA